MVYHYLCNNYSQTQVNDNGVISFNSRYNVRTPLSLPLYGSYRIIAPYWADVDTRGGGRIYYRQTSDPNLLSRAANEIRRGLTISENVTITNLLIATWDAVGYYYRKSDKVHNLCKVNYIHMVNLSKIVSYQELKCLKSMLQICLN